MLTGGHSWETFSKFIEYDFRCFWAYIDVYDFVEYCFTTCDGEDA